MTPLRRLNLGTQWGQGRKLMPATPTDSYVTHLENPLTMLSPLSSQRTFLIQSPHGSEWKRPGRTTLFPEEVGREAVIDLTLAPALPGPSDPSRVAFEDRRTLLRPQVAVGEDLVGVALTRLAVVRAQMARVRGPMLGPVPPAIERIGPTTVRGAPPPHVVVTEVPQTGTLLNKVIEVLRP